MLYRSCLGGTRCHIEMLAHPHATTLLLVFRSSWYKLQHERFGTWVRRWQRGLSRLRGDGRGRIGRETPSIFWRGGLAGRCGMSRVCGGALGVRGMTSRAALRSSLFFGLCMLTEGFNTLRRTGGLLCFDYTPRRSLYMLRVLVAYASRCLCHVLASMLLPLPQTRSPAKQAAICCRSCRGTRLWRCRGQCPRHALCRVRLKARAAPSRPASGFGSAPPKPPGPGRP